MSYIARHTVRSNRLDAEKRRADHLDASAFTPLGEVAAAAVAAIAKRAKISPDYARLVLSLQHGEARR